MSVTQSTLTPDSQGSLLPVLEIHAENPPFEFGATAGKNTVILTAASQFDHNDERVVTVFCEGLPLFIMREADPGKIIALAYDLGTREQGDTRFYHGLMINEDWGEILRTYAPWTQEVSS